MLTSFIAAYDVDPTKGSESGMGWNFSYEISKKCHVTLVTRKNNRKNIEAFVEANDINCASLDIRYYDLPDFVLRLKKKNKFWAIYYYLWNFFLALKFKKEIAKADVAHHLNFHSDLFPSFLWLFNSNFVWGPINHHERIEPTYLKRHYRKKDIFISELSWLIKRINWMLNPFLLITSLSSKHIFIGSEKVCKRLWHIKSGKTSILPSVGIERSYSSEAFAKNHNDSKHIKDKEFVLLSIGRHVPLKGFDLAIEAFRVFQQNYPQPCSTKLVIVGSGKYFDYFSELISRNDGYKNIHLHRWMEREKLKEYYSNSSLFLFPSHEGAGMVVAEAMIYGLPIVCLDDTGPAVMAGPCGVPVQKSNYDSTINELAASIDELVSNDAKRETLSESAVEQSKKFFWDVKASEIYEVYERVVAK